MDLKTLYIKEQRKKNLERSKTNKESSLVPPVVLAYAWRKFPSLITGRENPEVYVN